MFCPNCGNKVEDGMKFCNNCGNKLTPDVAQAVSAAAGDAFNQAEKELDNLVSDAKDAYQNFSGNGYNSNAGQAPAGGYVPKGSVKLQTDRNLLMYIVLSIVTCGIYSYYFIYKMAKDVNIACEGDGEQTGGLVKFILLSFITCGIYSLIWYYTLGNRLSSNAGRYGLHFQENGTTVLMWFIFGILICGIGPYMAMYILIKNTNAICDAYNRKNYL